MYTEDDLIRAKNDLDAIEQRWDRYSGNNPNKYQSELRSARSRLARIEGALKQSGIMEMTPHERVEAELNQTYPNPESKMLVEHNGRQYQCQYKPIAFSRSGKTVSEWKRSWVEVTDTHG